MPNRPQDPPEGSYSLHMAPAISRPTSPPPPRKTGPVDPLESAYAIIRDLREALKTADQWKAMLQKANDDLRKQLRELRCELGKYECPSCGEKDIAEYRYVDDRGETMCHACGGEWD
jgi:hypothetical protein